MTTMERVKMTPAGYEALQQRLKKLFEQRDYFIGQIKEALTHGDLSENAEYHAAKELHGQNEARIRELESALALAEIISVEQLSGDKATFGAWVTLLDEDTQESVCYQIVGAYEADVRQKKISIDSPLARAIIGKRVGDWVHVITPKGEEKSYDIQNISYRS